MSAYLRNTFGLLRCCLSQLPGFRGRSAAPAGRLFPAAQKLVSTAAVLAAVITPAATLAQGSAVPALPSAAQSTPAIAGSQATGQQGSTTQNGTQGAGQNGNNSNNNQDTQNNADNNTQRSNDRSRTDGRERNHVPDRSEALPSDFQNLVLSSTGVNLPVFGQTLFANAPSTFAPVQDIPVSPDYILGPGDQIRIQVFGQVNQQGTYTVSRTGDIAYPDLGTIHVAGIKYSDLADFIKSQLGRVYRNFQVNVNLGQLRSIQIFVFGAASSPGSYTVSSLSTLLNALLASGGPSASGTLRDIQLIRDGKTISHFDLYQLLLQGDKSSDAKLISGDIIFIPTVGSQVAVLGSVRTPAIYEIRRGTTVEDLLTLAGGRSAIALGGQLRLERIADHAQRSLIDVSQAEAPHELLQDGDIVTVGAILDRYKDAVTLRGNVSFPGRYVWHPGMRLLDLVPTQQQLITRDYYRRRNILGNVNRDYNQGVGALQLSGNNNTASSDVAERTGNSNTSPGGTTVASALTESSSTFSSTNDVVLSAPNIDWDYAVIERLDPVTLTTSLIPFNPGRLYKANDQSQNLQLEPGDVITFFSTADIRVPSSQQTRFVRLEGEFVAAGVYSVEPGETFRHLLTRAGGFTAEAYLYGSEFTRLSTRRVQQQRLNEYADSLDAQINAQSASSAARAITDRDASASDASATQARVAVARLRRIQPLGRIVLELKPDSRTIDAIPDLPLEDGDRFVVPRVPSTVSVEGQVYSANSFVFERGRKERDYLHQAGGPDRGADIKRSFILRADGSVYSRQYGNVEKATMFPGDTVVIPPQLDHRPLLRNLLDISNIVGQFGLGAAAVNVLR